MSRARNLKLVRQEHVDDPHHAAAVERGKAAIRALQDQRIIDLHGRRVRQDLPADMRRSEDREFGG